VFAQNFCVGGRDLPLPPRRRGGLFRWLFCVVSRLKTLDPPFCFSNLRGWPFSVVAFFCLFCLCRACQRVLCPVQPEDGAVHVDFFSSAVEGLTRIRRAYSGYGVSCLRLVGDPISFTPSFPLFGDRGLYPKDSVAQSEP